PRGTPALCPTPASRRPRGSRRPHGPGRSIDRAPVPSTAVGGGAGAPPSRRRYGDRRARTRRQAARVAGSGPMGALDLRSFVVAVPSARLGAAVRRIAVSLAVGSGEIVAVVDPVDDPGAGPADSTALARAVAGLVEPVAGQVLVH